MTDPRPATRRQPEERAGRARLRATDRPAERRERLPPAGTRASSARPGRGRWLLTGLALAWAWASLAALGARQATAAGPASARQATDYVLVAGTPYVLFHAEPGRRIRAELRRGEARIALAEAVAEEAPGGSAALLELHAPGRPGDRRSMRSGDRLDLWLADPAGPTFPITPTTSVEIPPLALSVDAARKVVAGVAPAGELLAFQSDRGYAEWSADAQGAFDREVSWLAPGQQGTLTLRGPGDSVTTAPYAALGATVTLGARELTGVATSGETVDTAVTRTDWRRTDDGLVPVTRTVAGGRVEVDGTGPLETPGAFELQLRDPVQPGDRISLTRASAYLPSYVAAATALTTSVAIEARDRVAGLAPAGAPVRIELYGPSGERRTATARAGDGGRWTHVLTDAPLGPGWWAAATIPLDDGLRQRAVTAVPRVRVHLRDARVTGIGPPGAAASITVLEPTGARRAGPWQVAIDPRGRFDAALRTRSESIDHATLVAPGDIVSIDFLGESGRGGDPILIAVPEMVAVADPMLDRVSGEAPAGGALEWALTEEVGEAEPTVRLRRALQVAGDGRWQADLAGTHDLEPPDAGWLTWTRSDGHQVRLAWAAIGLTLRIDGDTVAGNAPPLRTVTLTLQDGAGRTVGATRTQAGDRGAWQASWRDALGAAVAPRVGDRVRGAVGDQPDLDVTLPRLEAVVHVADDLVAGAAPPGASVRVTVPAKAEGEDEALGTHAPGRRGRHLHAGLRRHARSAPQRSPCAGSDARAAPRPA